MSTLSGIASKGEKGRSKFHSLDINYLYRGESLEPHQQKNVAHQRKHGMQTLGKVPATRRAPANLPSLKSEHSGNDPAYSLVPTGGTGWGSKPGETGPPPTSTTSTTPTTATTTQSTPAPPTQGVPVTLSAPASGSSTPAITTTTTPSVQPPPQPSTGTTHGHDKSWSAIMSNSNSETVPSFLAHQSPSFHQEFPSLFGETGGTSGTTVKSDNQYGPGPSLRPQTEGSWSQGGSRPQVPMGGTAGSQTGTAPVQGPLHLPPGPELGGVRSNLGPSGVGGGPAGPPHQTPQMLSHFKGVMPSFMFRPNYPGGFPPNFQGPVPRPPRFSYMPDRMMGAPRSTAGADPEELTQRPIIKEEDLNRMDDLTRDPGWATHDDIDYNQKLAFSDDETGQDDESTSTRSVRDTKETRTVSQQQQQNRDNERERDREQRQPADRDRDADSVYREERASSRGSRGVNEDDDILRDKKRQTSEEVAIAVERAKQRKEEEEKRFEESKQAAQRKLLDLEEKMKIKQQNQNQTQSGSSSSSTLDLKESSSGHHQHQDDQSIQGANIPLPEWERDRDRDKEKDRSDSKEQISAIASSAPSASQLDNRRDGVPRDRDHHTRDRDRDREREKQRDRDMRPEREQTGTVQLSVSGGGGSSNSGSVGVGGGGGGQSGSSHFKNNVPPRFLKRQQQQQQQQKQQPQPQPQQHGDPQRSGFFYRQNSSGSPQPLTTWPVGSGSTGGPNANHNTGGSGRSSNARRNRTDSELSDRERDRDDDLRGPHKNERRDRHTPDGYDRERERERPERYRSKLLDTESSASSTSSSSGGNRLGNAAVGAYDGRGKGPPSSSSGSGYYNGTNDYNFRGGYGRDYNNRLDRGVNRERDADSEDRHESHYFEEHVHETEIKKLHNTFDARDRDRDNRDSDWRDSIDRHSERDRPQRPDSRDSRTSRDSRNSRDSIREDTKSITESLQHSDRSSWADSPYDPEPREEKIRRDERRETSSARNPPYMQQRHIPGPITREKLEASEQRDEAKRNLIPLVRFEKKMESLKKTDSQTEKTDRKLSNDNGSSNDAWSRNSNVAPVTSPAPLANETESWADATDEALLKPTQSSAPTSATTGDKHSNVKTELDEKPSTTETQPQTQLPQSLPPASTPAPTPAPAPQSDKHSSLPSQKVLSADSSEPGPKKPEKSDISGRPEKIGGGRGGRGGRSNEGRSKDSWGGTFNVYNRGSWGRGGESRGRRGPGRGVSRSHSAHGWGGPSESNDDVSGDEVSASASISTESGKEEKRDRRDDRRNTPRSPKQGNRKNDRDDKIHERRDGDKGYPSGSDGRRYDKRSGYENSRSNAGGGSGREGFAPRGEPSRRGRGGFRTRGAARANIGPNSCVYGAPRKPFITATESTGKVDDKEKNLQVQSTSKDGEHNMDTISSVDDKMKLNQQALQTSIIGTTSPS